MSESHKAGIRIASWKRDIETFYQQEWPRLRALIRQLEEETWSDTQVEPESQEEPACVAPTRDTTISESSRESVDPLSQLLTQIDRQMHRTQSEVSKR